MGRVLLAIEVAGTSQNLRQSLLPYHELINCGDVQPAVELTQAQHPDLVLSDFRCRSCGSFGCDFPSGQTFASSVRSSTPSEGKHGS